MRCALRSILVMASAAVLLSGCSGGDDNAAGPEPAGSSPPAAVSQDPATEAGSGGNVGGDELDICAMVDAATVQEVLGEPAAATDQSTGALYACSWEGQGDALNVLSVSVYVHPDAATAAEQYELTMAGLEGSEITGLGQAASYNESFGLEVLHDRYDISVDNTGPDEKASDIMVAQLLIEKLTA